MCDYCDAGTVDDTATDAARMAVLAGGLFLDMVAPGWLETISWDDFDIRSTLFCVAGQTFGHSDCARGCYSGYEHLERCLGLDEGERIRLGFVWPTGYPGDTAYNATDLENAWREVWGPEQV